MGVCSRQLSLIQHSNSSNASYVQTLGYFEFKASNISDGHQKPKQLFGNGTRELSSLE